MILRLHRILNTIILILIRELKIICIKNSQIVEVKEMLHRINSNGTQERPVANEET